ncbi:efflux transporter periplasmic adaptor subunit [Rhodobacteraceae bacterium WD3A24]|nr:efflux transporter periplasmic adaptor subunit [Rhodobacteraceae bacterium WD3A24]
MRLSALWILPPVVLGAAVAAWFISQGEGPDRVASQPPGLAVRVAAAQTQRIRPVSRAWGNVRAADQWSAIAQVGGTVIWRHDDLEPGRLISANTEVLRIDPADYELAVAQAEADLAGLNAEAAQIDAEEENTRRILALEEARLELARSDLARVRELVAQGSAPPTRADETERGVLSARRVVTELENTLDLIPIRRRRLDAQIARTEAALSRARRDLANTRIAVPYDLRIARVETERFQTVNPGQTLLSGDGIDRVEVVAQIPVQSFRRLISPAQVPDDMLAALRSGQSPPLEARLRLIADRDQTWQGRVTRIEGALDPRARTVPVVVEVTAPYEDANPPLRLPLVPNMQVEVTLTGAALPDTVTVPESALHGDTVYVIDDEDRLVLQEVTPAFRQDGLAVIAEGLAAGTRVVLDDISPAIPGMRLDPVGADE